MNTLEQRLRFDKDAGKFFWIYPPKRHPDLIGKEAGCAQLSRGGKLYWVIQIDGKKHKRGHLVYLFINGRLPSPCLDHINGDSLDDRPCNFAYGC